MSFELKVDGDKDFGPRGAFDLEYRTFYSGIYEGNECLFVRMPSTPRGMVITFYPNGTMATWSDSNNHIRGAREVKVTICVAPEGSNA